LEFEGDRRLQAIMFTDIVGYSALTQSDEKLAILVIERHNRLLRPLFAKHNGREIKSIGDSFLLEFDSALEATTCAIEIREFLHDYNISSKEDWKIKLRIGIHLGDVIHKGRDIFGDAVNIASRIEPLAQPEGICVSEQIYSQVHNKIDQQIEELSSKDTKLKNIVFPTKVYAIVMTFQRVRDFTEVNEDFSVTAVDRNRRIAILPFSNISPDPGDEYFADGMTEELISLISKIHGLRVISRTSIMRYKGANKSTTEIGQELRAGNLLEGSIRKVGSRLRIAVQLIDAKSDEHVWSETYDRDLQDVFAIQTEISTNVANALKIRLLPKEMEIIEKIPTKNQEAFTLYLKGRFHFNKLTGKEFENAIEYFQLAIEEDPSFALALVGLADSFWYLGGWSYLPRNEVHLRAKQFAERALEIDSMLPDAHLSMALILLDYEWDFNRAEYEFRRSIELNPSFARAYAYHALWTIYHGEETKFSEALSEIRHSIELDPMSTETLTVAASALMYAGRYDEAIEEFTKAIHLDPNVSLAHDNLGLAYVRKGMYDQAIAEIQAAIELTRGKDAYEKADLVYALTKAGMLTEARKLVQELQDGKKYPHVSAFAVAAAYSALDEKDEAFKWLDRAYEDRSTYMFIIVKGGFMFDNIRADPRFEALMKRIGLKN
jgi:adenylate cyclase